MSGSAPITVSQLNSYIKVMFESDSNMHSLFVCGEISNLKKHYSSGHVYFSLKDEKSTIRAVMFSGYAQKIKFDIKDGMKVVVKGNISCYELRGEYQIYAVDIQPDGLGAVYLAFKQLKDRLAQEGLFDQSLKKELPSYPEKIGVITSRTGAVIHDIQITMSQMYPLCEIILYPVNVQGETAATQIADAVRYFNNTNMADVIIIGRGGGSAEELWTFNDERLVRAVHLSQIPVISAVGHETDFTLCDFAADKRAATPTAAAEMAVPNANNVKAIINDLTGRIAGLSLLKIKELSGEARVLKSRLSESSPANYINLAKEHLFRMQKMLKSYTESCVCAKRHSYELCARRITSISPEQTLGRGYSIILKNGKSIKSVKELSNNDKVKIVFCDGTLECELHNIKLPDSKKENYDGKK